MTNSVMVDVAMGTYNHEKFIAQALDSVLMQKTNFTFRIIICDDLSTDDTRSIIMSYDEKYPGKIITVFPDKHYGLTHKDRPYPKVLKQCTAKYIAMLEGDDYWTDPYKLQRQVGILENEPDVAIVFHDVSVVDAEGKTLLASKIKDYWGRVYKNEYTPAELAGGAAIPTVSAVFRNVYLSYDGFSRVTNADTYLYALLGMYGSAKMIPGMMGAYRVHERGVWSALGREKQMIASVATFRELSREMAMNLRPYTIMTLGKHALGCFFYFVRRGKIIRGMSFLFIYLKGTFDLLVAMVRRSIGIKSLIEYLKIPFNLISSHMRAK